MKQTLLCVFLTAQTLILFAQNVGVGTSNPQQKLDVAGNIRLDDNMMVEGSSAYRVYRNLATYNSSTSAAAGAFVVTTAQPWNSACMFRVELEGYFYDGTAPFEFSIAGYMYVNNDFYNYGYINTGSKKLLVRLAKNNSTNTIALIIGDEGATYSYPKISVRSFMQGHSNISEAYADSWTITQVTTLSNFSYIITVPDVTQAAPSPGSGNYIQNQNVVAQAADYWISGIGRASQYQLTNANTALTQGAGNALRITTNSGYTEIGAQNGSWSHFVTDRARYYFNKGITVDEGLIGSYDEDLSLQTQGTTRIIVKNGSGNVGIATTSPSALLHLAGAHSTTQARLTLPAGNNGGGTGEVNMQLWVSEPGITWDAGGIGTNVTNDGGSPAGFSRINTSLGQSYIRFITNGGAMAFNTTNNAGTYYPTMYMTSGNVGVGTTSPSEKLDVSGNVRATGIVYWGNAAVRTETRNDAGLRGDAGARSGFYETSSPSPSSNWPTGASSWWHLLDVRHSNNGNNYALQLAGSFFDQDLYYRKTADNAAQPWSKVLTTNGSIGQGYNNATSGSELALDGNNTGSISYSPGVGWTPGTFMGVSGMSVTRTITSGNMVMITFTARVEGDNYNYYVPSAAWFRILRNGAEIARSATPVAYRPTYEWYYTNNNVSMTIMDSGISGSTTYSVEYWLPNEFGATERVFLGERYLNVIELRQ